MMLLLLLLLCILQDNNEKTANSSSLGFLRRVVLLLRHVAVTAECHGVVVDVSICSFHLMLVVRMHCATRRPLLCIQLTKTIT